MRQEMVSTFVKATRLKKHNWRLLAVRLRNTTTHLFNEMDCRADWNEATARICQGYRRRHFPL